VYAPAVAGDNIRYGYKISGHGKPSIGQKCEDCHDLMILHVDGNARTYSAVTDNYRQGYRLNQDMIIPRVAESNGEGAFHLCTYNCHPYNVVTGPESNFREEPPGAVSQKHDFHLDPVHAMNCWDSDWDDTVDSAVSCTACHNVHGPPMDTGDPNTPLAPNPVMIRHGELISSPGTNDKVPALDFIWYEADGSTQTTVLQESRYGSLLCGDTDLSFNHVCGATCHFPERVSYFRDPRILSISQIHPGQQEASVPSGTIMNALNNALGYTCPDCIQTVRYGRVRMLGAKFGPSRLPGDQVRIGDPRAAAPIALQYDTDANPYTVENVYGGVSLYIGWWSDEIIGIYLYPEPGQVLRALYGPDLGIGLHWLDTWLGMWVVKDNEGDPVASNVVPIRVLTPLPD
jgi:hypothetical protein